MLNMDYIKKRHSDVLFAILGVVLWFASDGLAYDINDKLSIGGIMAGVYQYQRISDVPGFDSEGRGVLVFQPEISFKPTDSDEIFAKFGFGVGNGLIEEGQSPFFLAPWAVDVQDDYRDIKGTSFREDQCPGRILL